MESFDIELLYQIKVAKIMIGIGLFSTSYLIFKYVKNKKHNEKFSPLEIYFSLFGSAILIIGIFKFKHDNHFLKNQCEATGKTSYSEMTRARHYIHYYFKVNNRQYSGFVQCYDMDLVRNVKDSTYEFPVIYQCDDPEISEMQISE